MRNDIPELLDRAAELPTPVLDAHELWLRGSRRRRQLRMAGGLASLAVLTAATVLATSFLAPPDSIEVVNAPEASPTGRETRETGGAKSPESDPIRISIRTGTVWASDEEVFWGSGCLRSLPPQCGRELRILGLSAQDLAALPGAESQRDGDDGPLITWLADPVRLVADYDRSAGTLTVVAPLTVVSPEESADDFDRYQFGGDHRPDAPCEPVGSWDGPAPTNLDHPEIHRWLEAVDRYTATVDDFVHRWFAEDWVLVVQFTDASDHLERLAEAYPAPLCVEEVEYSAEALNQTHDAISEARAPLREDGVLLLSHDTSHRGVEILVFLADDHSIRALEQLVPSEMVDYIHVVGLAAGGSG